MQKTSFELLDERFEKVAYLNEEIYKAAAGKNDILKAISKKTKPIVKSLNKSKKQAGSVVDVFTGKNISRAEARLAALEGISGAGSTAKSLASTVSNADQLMSDRSLRLAGNDFSSKIRKANSNLPTSSNESGIKALKENIMNRKEFSSNKKKREVLESIEDSVGRGKSIDYDDLITRPSILGNKTYDPGLSSSDIKAYNESARYAKGAKRINPDNVPPDDAAIRTKERIGNAFRKVKGLPPKTDPSQYASYGASRADTGLRKANLAMADVRAALDPLSETMSANIGSGITKAKSKVNKEMAKTVGAYTAVGGGLAVGAGALSPKTTQPQNNNNNQPYKPTYKSENKPSYNNINNMDKMAQAITEELSK